MNCYMFIDFGSTFTKVTLIDIEKEEILATSKAYTTVEKDVTLGLTNAINKIKKEIDFDSLNIVKTTACSSAAGGLKVVAIGLVPELTAEAAKRTALGAGARIIETYSYDLNKDEMSEIKNSDVDIILLAGGTDGGNTDTIIHNAYMLATHNIDVPIVVAGNKSANDQIRKIFDEDDIEYYMTENVMPTLNEINVLPAREVIRQIFMENITKAKGMDQASKYIDNITMPTPASVLNAAKVLSEGTNDEEGLGDLIVLDIGGATTDIHSIGKGDPSKPGVTYRGLQEPFSKRTVEGDLGMRYSSMAVYEACGNRKLEEVFEVEDYQELESGFRLRYENTDFVAESEEEKIFDTNIARICAELSIGRHAGEIETVYSPLGSAFNQRGKDLTQFKYVIGTGGVIVNNDYPDKILEATLFDENDPTSLRPQDPKFVLDADYILSAMGLLAMIDEDMAIRILKKYLKEI